MGSDFFDPVKAANFPETRLCYRNNLAAKSIGLEGLSDADWTAHFGRFEPLEHNLPQPLALRYHGHQFRHYNPDIGDGRGFLFAQCRAEDGRFLDLGTKGSGQTPYSRRGDGRLTLLGGIREVLATSYLNYLGVNTSKSLSLIETGEALHRGDEPSPTRSAVLVRLSHSHIRFGTFQRLSFLGQDENLTALVDYVCRHYYQGCETAQDMFEAVLSQSADKVASWMAAGFVHGVMNTDNMNVTAESFDYGPYRFLPSLQSGFTAAYFDHQGLYAFGRQAEAMYWNLSQLAQSLSLIADDKALIASLDGFADQYKDRLCHHVFRRLGIERRDIDRDIELVLANFKFLETSQTPWPQFWHDWRGGADQQARAKSSPNGSYYDGAEFNAWFDLLKTFNISGPPSTGDRPPSLLYEDIGALWSPIDQHDDWSSFHEKVKSFNP